MLKAIGDRLSVKTVITDARLITNFVYNHSWLLAAMRERCGGDIVRPGATRFATNYIALSSFLKHKQGLRELFAAHDYVEWKKRLTKVTYRIEELVLGNSFWDKVRGVVGIIEPIYVVLRMVDNETNPSMGSLYPSIQLMKEAIMVKAPNAYKWVHAIIDDPYFLNPKYQYSWNLFDDNSLKRAVHEVYDHLFPDCPGKGTFGSEIVKFRDAVGMFGCHPAVKSRNAMMPCEWWSMYGTDCEVLQRLAVRVLAQTVSSSPCERNWSTFSLIHTNKRNRIGYERLQKLLYCHYNMKLRERLLRSERRRKAQEDPLDLMTVGQHAYAEDAEDDLVY
ncbi:uncharacterized protein LOC131249559 [Magnolia sinica]|uniref:uncharacterized protein LOC131249559 n=1 Tax=Magnolia sinica TaxID=86752 RepID=UPI00265AD8FF|nr:uncharacterized protein LOC131249559 [Magnolia sinica]